MNALFARVVIVAAVSLLLAGCGSRSVVGPGGVVWLNPEVEENCEQLARVIDEEEPGGSIPKGFPLPDGAEVAGTARGDPPTVRVRAPGEFLDVDAFFKSKLEDEGWAGGSSGNGSDPNGEYGYVLVNGHGYKGTVEVIQCGDDDPAVLVQLEPKQR